MKLIECKYPDKNCNAQRWIDRNKVCGAPIPLSEKIKCKPILEEDLERINHEIQSKNDEIKNFREGKPRYNMTSDEKEILECLKNELSELEKEHDSITEDLNNGNYRGMKK